jgi:Cys-tRNA(Pro)/Cys-tRNA(Cys) deacylase
MAQSPVLDVGIVLALEEPFPQRGECGRAVPARTSAYVRCTEYVSYQPTRTAAPKSRSPRASSGVIVPSGFSERVRNGQLLPWGITWRPGSATKRGPVASSRPVTTQPPDTPAIRAIAAAGVDYRVVETRPARDPEESARLQGIELRQLLRTIVVRRGGDDYVFVLVPAGRRFDWPKLRAHLGVNRLSLPDQDEAKSVTGYERGAITPFGASRAWPVVADASILGLERVAIGGGRRGVNLHLTPEDLVAATGADVVDVTTSEVVPEG